MFGSRILFVMFLARNVDSKRVGATHKFKTLRIESGLLASGCEMHVDLRELSWYVFLFIIESDIFS